MRINGNKLYQNAILILMKKFLFLNLLLWWKTWSHTI